jgi:hypothetical protein
MHAYDASASQPLVGFHWLEQDLFTSGDVQNSGPAATALLDNTRHSRHASPPQWTSRP